jgi:hypothetical protein
LITMSASLVNWWVEVCDTVTGGYLSRRLRSDDQLFVAMLAAWIVLDGLVSCALLGWSGGVTVLLGVGGLIGTVTIAAQSGERLRESPANPQSRG